MSDTNKSDANIFRSYPEQKLSGRFLSGHIAKLRKKTNNGRYSEVKYFNVLVEELQKLRSPEEHAYATIGNL